MIFGSVEEGLAAGYTPCRRCCPEQQGWKGSKAELADKAEKYMQAHYQEKFSLKKIALQFFVNESYLLRVFKEVKGETMLECHNRIRCDAAKDLLTRNELSISFIGDSVGFTSAAHFSRIFRKETGLSPSEWRKEYLSRLTEDVDSDSKLPTQ